MQVTRRSALLGLLGSLGPVSGRAAQANGAETDYEAATGGRVGIYAENVVSGARLEWRADEHFVMCSPFKASLAALILSRVDRGEDHLDTRSPTQWPIWRTGMRRWREPTWPGARFRLERRAGRRSRKATTRAQPFLLRGWAVRWR